ncbi:MAG: tripartite tricarboxylate transporter substrate binding protein [Burkholderiales bacterium]|jgi:tripartite-type tricarboxylate transporter receptor subunit TctC|nr:tripartite tricarboxylate transporter substrate binding protein [Burkholderiales bacterium]
MPRIRQMSAATAAALAALASLPALGASAPPYPVKPVRLIIANTPGTSVDALARVLAVRLGEELGAQIVPDNRGGAGGLIGGEIASRSAPDGYTLLVSSTGMQVITPQIYKGLSYDPIRDFVPLSLVAITHNMLVVTPTLPVQTVQELIAHARTNPGRLNMSNAGSGFQSHLAGVLFTHMTGINVQHVPYKGGASLVAVIGNEAQVTIAPMPAVIGHVRAGKLRAIATGGEKRSVVTPTLPTISEAGVPGFVSTGWMGLMLPAGPSRAGPPKPLYERLRSAVVKVVEDPVTREQMERQGGEAVSSTPEAFLQLIREEFKRFQTAIGLAGLKVD